MTACGIRRFGDFKKEVVVVPEGSGCNRIGNAVGYHLLVVGIKLIIPPPIPDLTATAVTCISLLFLIEYRVVPRIGCEGTGKVNRFAQREIPRRHFVALALPGYHPYLHRPSRTLPRLRIFW